jgi:NADH-quinone oxidoreductase subunit N
VRDYTLFIPEYWAATAAVLIIATEIMWPTIRRELLAYLTAGAAVIYGAIALFYIPNDPASFMGLIQVDDFTTFFRVLGAAIVAVTAILSANYMKPRAGVLGEFYGLLLVAGIGLTFMAASRELLTAYIALEILSFSLYVLVGYARRDVFSAEASLKYILLGAFASAMLLYGVSIIYGVSGSTFYDGIAAGLAERGDDTDIALVVGLMLVIAGVGFKVSAAPFHMWAPDAYQGAPLPITAFLSTASKAAGFALILRLFSASFVDEADSWRWAIAGIAVATMVVGNLVAIQQTDLKRLVAYSSIGQVGYMLVVIAAIGYGGAEVGEQASSALLLHIVGYVISTLALFTALTAYYDRTGRDSSIQGIRGMAETQPYLALIITVALFSFAGLPFFAGFATKLFMFQASAERELLWVIGVAVTASFVSLYYYLMVIRQMYLFEPDGGLQRFRLTPLMWGLGTLLLVGVLFIGIYPGPVFELADKAVEPLFRVGVDLSS